MSVIYTQYYNSPFGELVIGSYNNQIVLCDWRFRKLRSSIDHRLKVALNAEFVQKSTSVIEETILQLNEYFHRDRQNFDLQIKLIGTNFQKTVWRALQNITFGKTQSYLQLSKSLNNVKAIRAVASANGANAIAIIVPCHRIIGTNGELTGYAGGLNCKKKLLQLEGALPQQELNF